MAAIDMDGSGDISFDEFGGVMKQLRREKWEMLRAMSLLEADQVR